MSLANKTTPEGQSKKIIENSFKNKRSTEKIKNFI